VNEKWSYIQKCYDDVAQAKRMFLLLRKSVRLNIVLQVIVYAVVRYWLGHLSRD